jgi:hypothetical protein
MRTARHPPMNARLMAASYERQKRKLQSVYLLGHFDLRKNLSRSFMCRTQEDQGAGSHVQVKVLALLAVRASSSCPAQINFSFLATFCV